MALALKKYFGSFVTQLYLRDCAPSSAFRLRGLFISDLPVCTDSNVKRKGNDAREEKNVDSQEKIEKKTEEEQVFSASMAVRARRSPSAPPISEGSGGKTH